MLADAGVLQGPLVGVDGAVPVAGAGSRSSAEGESHFGVIMRDVAKWLHGRLGSCIASWVMEELCECRLAGGQQIGVMAYG